MKLQDISAEIFGQLSDLTAQLTPEAYTQPLDLLSANSIGKHLRHIIEFYELALTGCRAGILNYDRRNRVLALETDPQAAMIKLQELAVLMHVFTEDRVLVLEAAYSPNPKPDISITTTFYRELLYNIEHAVHHMAIIRIALAAVFPQITVPHHFGVAYSTVQHQQTTQH